MSISANSLSSMFNVFTQKSLEQFIAERPPAPTFTEIFSDEVMNQGQVLTTRIPSTHWGSSNDLSVGWQNTKATGSKIDVTLKLRDFDTPFNLLEWPTVGPKILFDIALKPAVDQLANSVVVDAINTLSTSSYTTYLSGSTASALNLTGSFSLQSASVALTKNEIPLTKRYALLSPDAFAGVTNQVVNVYQYGGTEIVRNFSVPNLLGFTPVFPYARFYGSSTPQGGDTITINNHMVGVAGHPQALVLAVRQPFDFATYLPGALVSAVAVDPTSKLSLMTFAILDPSGPVVRVGAAALYGVAVGNTNAAIPLIVN